MRKTVLGLAGSANVSSSRCAQAIKVVSANLFNRHLEDNELPCSVTCDNIIKGEGEALAKIQVAEAVLNSTSCTLHGDGTSQDQKKIFSQQLTLNSGETLSLGFNIVASEDDATILDVTIQQFNELADLYCEVTDDERDTVFRDLLKKITSFMTDRAAVKKTAAAKRSRNVFLFGSNNQDQMDCLSQGRFFVRKLSVLPRN